MKKLIIVAMLALSACETTYESGTKSQQLADNVHRISMRGNGATSKTQATDYAVLKAAEVTIDNGHRYFIVTNTQDATRRTSYTAPSTATTTTNSTGNASIYGNTLNAYGTTTTNSIYNPAQTYNFTLPGLDMMIETYADKPAVGHFDAQQVTKYLGAKLNPDRWAPKE